MPIFVKDFRSKLILILVTLLFCLTASVCVSGEVRVNWALLVETENGVTALDVSKPLFLDNKAALQLYLHPEQGTYIYIFLHDSSGSFSTIFPPNSSYYDSNLMEEPVRIPSGAGRFTFVPPPGEEKIFFIASASRFTDVEALIDKCNREPDNVELQAELNQMVRALRRKFSNLTQFTEKGMPVSGTRKNLIGTRGAGEEDFTVTKVAAKEFYSKILRLSHE